MGLSIVDIGKKLQEYGLKVGENPAFGGVSGVHAKGSFHYAPGGQAIDVTDWRPDVAPAFPGGKPIPWKQRTGELSWRAKQLGMFDEALGPGDPGHDTHVHLALSKAKDFTPQQLQWLATGRYTDAQGKLTDVMPGASSVPQPAEQPTAQPTENVTYNLFVNPDQTGRRTPLEFLTGYKNRMMMTPKELLEAFAPRPGFNPVEKMSAVLNSQPNYMGA